MPPPHLRTSDIARTLGSHVNTVRLYETKGFLPDIPRGENGYRQYTAMHLEQAHLVQLTLQSPYLGNKTVLIDPVKYAAGDLGRRWN
ncbi:MAG: MerR family DNA-binding transcriptional regulator [Chloroflexia bacterium]